MNLADNIPQGDIDAADRRPAHHAVAVPEVLAEHHLPQILDARRIFADEQRRQVLDRADDAPRVPLQRRLAPPPQPGLIGQDFDKDPIAHPRIADMRFNAGDFHASESDSARAPDGTTQRRAAYQRDRSEPRRYNE